MNPQNYLIKNEDFLFRRVSKKNPNYWKEINGVKVPSSFAFKTKLINGKMEDGLSVNIAALTTVKKTIENFPNDAVAEILASYPLSLGYKCIHKASKNNNAHAIIEGDTNPIARELSKAITQVFNFE